MSRITPTKPAVTTGGSGPAPVSPRPASVDALSPMPATSSPRPASHAVSPMLSHSVAGSSASSALSPMGPPPKAVTAVPVPVFNMGAGGLAKHSKADDEKETEVDRVVRGRRGKPNALVSTTVRQESTLIRHMDRLNRGEGTPTGNVIPTKMGDAPVYSLSTRTAGRAPSLYARKKDGGVFPIGPSDGKNYDSSEDEH